MRRARRRLAGLLVLAALAAAVWLERRAGPPPPAGDTPVGFAAVATATAAAITWAGLADVSALPPPEPESWQVTYVVDGDTLRVRRGAETDTLRLVGIDAPETAGPYRAAGCHGEEASAALGARAIGRGVHLATDPVAGARDHFNRRLAYAWLDDGTELGAWLVAEGHARAYAYRGQRHAYRAVYEALEDAAVRAGLGLWDPAGCGGGP